MLLTPLRDHSDRQYNLTKNPNICQTVFSINDLQ